MSRGLPTKFRPLDTDIWLVRVVGRVPQQQVPYGVERFRQCRRADGVKSSATTWPELLSIGYAQLDKLFTRWASMCRVGFQ